MKTLMTILASLSISSTVMAAQKDLDLMNSLTRAGVQAEPGTSKLQVGVDDVECAFSIASNRYDCNMTDISANDGKGVSRSFVGRTARKIYNSLMDAGAPSDNGLGKVFVSAKSIRCSQSAKGVADGSAADRTACSIELQ